MLLLDLQKLPISNQSAFSAIVTQQRCIIITSVYPKKWVNIPLNVIAYLNKPFTFEQFTDAIEKFVEIVDD